MPTTDHSEDVDLIGRALAGENDAIRHLVHRLMPIVRATVRRALGFAVAGHRLGVEVEDLEQDVWLHLVAQRGRRLSSFRPDRGISLESYVTILAEREVITQLRRRAALKRGRHLQAVCNDSVPSPDPTPEQRVADRQLVASLHRSLEAQLPERGRLIWRYTFTDGREPREVAELIGVKVQVVYNWQHKIRQLAREFFTQSAERQKTSSPSA